MILFPHAKINLGLNVIRRRDDGYHEIRTVMVPIPLHDALEAIIAPELPAGRIEFTRTGLDIPGEPEQDLCWKAAKMIAGKDQLPGIRLHLHKTIPMGAGLGGGSSDGAHTLILLNTLCSLNIPPRQLKEMAEQLGSDCPFFLEKKIQLATGTGGSTQTLDLDLKGWWLFLVYPNEHIGTAEVYRNCQPSGQGIDLRQILVSKPVRAWQDVLINDLQDHVVETRPPVALALATIKAAGASYAAMSGSGSAVFGLFDHEPVVSGLPIDLRTWSLRL